MDGLFACSPAWKSGGEFYIKLIRAMVIETPREGMYVTKANKVTLTGAFTV